MTVKFESGSKQWRHRSKDCTFTDCDIVGIPIACRGVVWV